MQLDGVPTGRLRVQEEVLYLFIKKPDDRGAIVAVDLNTHKVKWMGVGDKEWASDVPQVWKSLVLAGNCQGRLSAFSAATGEEIWSEQLKGCIRSIGVSGDVLYVGAQEGFLYALRPSEALHHDFLSMTPNRIAAKAQDAVANGTAGQLAMGQSIGFFQEPEQ